MGLKCISLGVFACIKMRKDEKSLIFTYHPKGKRHHTGLKCEKPVWKASKSGLSAATSHRRRKKMRETVILDSHLN